MLILLSQDGTCHTLLWVIPHLAIWLNFPRTVYYVIINSSMDKKFTTILCSDVIGYSKLMGSDEIGTLQKLERCRDIIDSMLIEHEGRIFNTGGDSVLAEFDSPTQAVKFAKSMQERMISGSHLRWRIGIHSGEVFIYGTNLLGDTVNIAARIESCADYGGVCISDATYGLVNGKVNCEFKSRGKQQFKNITRPIEIWAVDGIQGSELNPNSNPISAPKYSREQLIKSVMNDTPAQNKTVQEAQHYKRDRRYNPAVRILLWRITKKCQSSIDEIIDMAEKNLVPQELRDLTVVVLTEYTKNCPSERAIKIAKLLESGNMGDYRGVALKYWHHASKTNPDAAEHYGLMILGDDHSSESELTEAIDLLTHSAESKKIKSMMTLAEHHERRGNLKDAFIWYWVARDFKVIEAQICLERLSRTISKSDFQRFKLEGEAKSDWIKFHNTDKFYS